MNLVHFTQSPRRVTGVGPSSEGDVVEFINFRAVQLTLKVIGFEGASDPVLQIAMETGMRSDRDFVPLGRFLPMVAAGEITTRHFEGLLHFARWNVVQLAGATAVWFEIEGEALP